MVAIRTILCPVDFSPATERQVGLAVDLCRLVGARLVIHHNLEEAPSAVGVSWMWAHDHPDRVTEQDDGTRLQRLLDGLPAGIAAEGKITHGLAATAVLRVRAAVNADLLLLSTHGSGSADHTSITRQILDRVDCPVLALHEPCVDCEDLRFDAAVAKTPQVLLVPTDLTKEAAGALQFAFALARLLPFELHLLHVVETTAKSEPPTPARIEGIRHLLLDLIPDELTGRADVHVATGAPASTIAKTAEELHAVCIVMGGHARGPLRRWLTHDNSGDVLHQARCPVWFVPGGIAA